MFPVHVCHCQLLMFPVCLQQDLYENLRFVDTAFLLNQIKILSTYLSSYQWRIQDFLKEGSGTLSHAKRVRNF